MPAKMPSIRSMRTVYKKMLQGGEFERRDRILAQASFYGGARVMLLALSYVVERGDDEELKRNIRRHARTARRLYGRPSANRRH
jgi:hypothetical protein